MSRIQVGLVSPPTKVSRGDGKEWSSKSDGFFKLINLSRRRLCVLGVERSSRTHILTSKQDLLSPILNEEACSSCCSCGRRRLLASILASVLATTPSIVHAESNINYAELIESIHPKRPDWYEEFYAQVLEFGMKSYEAEVAAYKSELFSKLNHGTVLELGVGTGPNLKYYAKSTGMNVIAVDPNEKMERYARAAALDSGLDDTTFTFIHGVGESIPLPSSSVDAVVSTLVLCSVKQVSSALEEINRVLKPGGTYYFMEHVAAQDGSVLKFWQDLLDPAQQLVADGCHLNRDILSSVQAATFQSVTAQRISVKSTYLISPHVIGMARSAKSFKYEI